MALDQAAAARLAAEERLAAHRKAHAEAQAAARAARDKVRIISKGWQLM